MSQSIDKSKFTFIQQDEKLYDDAFQTKPIGYFKDAWMRFRKNKASYVAAIILLFLILMSIVGPLFVSYDLDDVNAKWANRLKDLPPKSELLDFMPGFSGRKELTGFPQNFSNLPSEIVLEVKGINQIGQLTVVVDYYAYVNYYFSEFIDPDTQTYANTAYTNLTTAEYGRVKEAENDLGVTIILEDEVNPDRAASLGFYRVRLDFYEFLDHIYGIEDVSFFFGSDGSGRDLFKEIWKGARVSLLVAFAVASINIIIGVIIGSISGYFGGNVDLIIERVSEILAGLPFLAILTLLLLRFGNELWVVILAFTLTGWLGIAGLTRSQFYRYKNREYVLAARTLGAGDARIMARHIFPSAVGTIITSVVLYIPGVIFTESTFSFLGIINYADVISVGRLLANGQNVMKQSFYQLLFPAIFISMLMLSFNLFGNGLRDAFNPSLRGVEE